MNLEPKAWAMGVTDKSRRSFTSTYDILMKTSGTVDGGIPEGKLLLKSSYKALINSLPKLKTATYIFDPRDFILLENLDYKKLEIPMWAWQGVVAFRDVCLVEKLGIQIPF